MQSNTMEEEEEIDILGDYDGLSKNEREISNISAGQILSCDYTVHPRWLVDNSLSGDFAGDNVVQEVCIENDESIVYSSEDEYENQLETSVIENDWSNELACDNNIILEESIPATVEEEVIALSQEDDEEVYDNSYDHKVIPHSHEEIVETTPIVPSSSRSLLKINHIFPQPSKPHPRSLLKMNHPQPKFVQTLTVDRSLLKSNKGFLKKLNRKLISAQRKLIGETMYTAPSSHIKSQISTTPKFKQKVKMKLNNSSSDNNKLKKRLLRSKSHRSRKNSASRHKKSGIVYDENITINHTEPSIPMEASESHAIVPKLSANTNNEDSDIEIDIESGEADFLPQITVIPDNPDVHDEIVSDTQNKVDRIKTQSPLDNYSNENIEFITNLLSNCSVEVKKLLTGVEVPNEELKLCSTEASDLEKIVHMEFFKGRPTKTPDRYMKIRGHILNTWLSMKPAYVSKTAVRSGLKHCGDVNCISRIHSLLEQIGAINFGCQGEHFQYIRPLTTLVSAFTLPPRPHKSTSSSSYITQSTSGTNNVELDRKQRHKPVSYKMFDSNFTISHEDNEKQRSSTKNVSSFSKHHSPPWNYEFELIKCEKFESRANQPFKVSITLSTLMCFYLHGLSSKFEVMGFLGGYRSKSIGRDKLSIARYKPCQTSEQSGTMCEMCPVSQVEQSTSLLAEGYDLLGWFHTHPLFPPNPSRTDVRTQAEMQLQFASDDDTPFIGLILGCLDMKCKCIYIMPSVRPLTMSNGVPYEIQIEIIKDCASFADDVMDVIRLIKQNGCDLQLIMDKFLKFANDLLQSHGYDENILNAFKEIILK